MVVAKGRLTVYVLSRDLCSSFCFLGVFLAGKLLITFKARVVPPSKSAFPESVQLNGKWRQSFISHSIT